MIGRTLKTISIAVVGSLLLTLATAVRQPARAAESRGFKWVVWIVEPCTYPCDPGLAGCDTNPDCGCDCFR